MIGILLVDDYAPVRDGLRMRLSLEPDLHVVGEAPDGLHAIRMATHLSPQLIIMDSNMPQMDGLATAAHLRAASIDSEIIILTSEDSLTLKEDAKAAGVAAVFPKNGRIDQLITAIRAIMSSHSSQLALT